MGAREVRARHHIEDDVVSQTAAISPRAALQRQSTRTCEYSGCARHFVALRPAKRFCSSQCRMAAWEAANPRVPAPRPLLDIAARPIADTSLEAFAGLVDDLNHLERDVFYAIHAYLQATGYADVSGKELADWWRRDVTSVRPRVTGLYRKGYVLKGPIRDSRVREKRVHGVRPVVAKAAVERAAQNGKAE